MDTGKEKERKKGLVYIVDKVKDGQNSKGKICNLQEQFTQKYFTIYHFVD